MADTREGGVYKVGDGFVDAAGKEVEAPSAAEEKGDTDLTSADTGTDGDTGPMPYVEILSAGGFKDASSVRAASDEDLLALEGIGPARLAEIRAFKG